jgi:phosphoserine aminotransferase
MPTTLEKPLVRPRNPLFSSGPCAKRPGWTPEVLAQALVGRSHRGKEGKARLKYALDLTRSLLRLPADYRIAIVAGSDTGAFEMAMWSLLGARGVEVLAWESFGHGWATDVVMHLRLSDVRVMRAEYGTLPQLAQVDFERDVLFTWNGTTSGTRVPNADWIPSDRHGLTLVDATSAIFAQQIDWAKTDVVTFSWQKVLGGEAAHGMLILSPRAVERLESYVPPWPLPKLFRMTKSGELNQALFEGETINTPSMLCIEDYLDCLRWAESAGGLRGLTARADSNANAIYEWIERTPWIANLAVDRATWSNTSVCLKIVDSGVTALAATAQADFAKDMVASLEKEKVAYDIGSYRDAPPGLRIWTGSTVETDDLRALIPWLDWAFAAAKRKLSSVS